MERSFADVKETSFAQTHKKICQIISVDAELPVADPPKIRRLQFHFFAVEMDVSLQQFVCRDMLGWEQTQMAQFISKIERYIAVFAPVAARAYPDDGWL